MRRSDFSCGDEVAVLGPTNDVSYYGEFHGFNGDGTATVKGAPSPASPEGLRNVSVMYLRQPNEVLK